MWERGLASVVKFTKYQALGNDYLVVDPAGGVSELSPFQIQRICDRHHGVGSDGILLGPLETQDADFGLRLFNPDGGEFEKSGNGLRIFARYLWDKGRVEGEPFTIMTPGGKVTAQVHGGARVVSVDMGQISFDSLKIPVEGPPREVLNEVLHVRDQAFRYCAATIGNPHCVILDRQVTPEEAQHWGPGIERDPRFPNRTNVQFMRVLDRSHIQIEIWERGAGYTLASGSSSCAAAAVAHRLDRCDAEITVKMPGGSMDVVINPDWSVRLTGAVTCVCEGLISEELFTTSL
jgi:diaminopimelate epimerase